MQWVARTLMVAGALYVIYQWIRFHVDAATRDGVGWRVGLADAGNGCLGIVGKGLAVIVALVVASVVFNALPSCSRYRGEPQNYRR